MIIMNRGSLRFERISSPGLSRKELLNLVLDSGYEKTIHDLYEYDCFPEEGGRDRKFVLDDDIFNIRFDPATLQAAERQKLLEGARKANEKILDADLFAEILKEIEKNLLRIKPDLIDTDNIPKSWRGVMPCLRRIISVQLKFTPFEIQARARKAVTLGGEKFPENDLVAAFRLTVPTAYRFVLITEANPKCCSGDAIPLTEPTKTVSEEFYSFSKIKLPKGFGTPYAPGEDFNEGKTGNAGKGIIFENPSIPKPKKDE